MENSLAKTSFSGSLSAYWGLSMFAGVAGALAYGFESTFFAVVTGLIGIGTAYGYAIDRFSKVAMRNEELIVSRGIFGKKNVINLNNAVLSLAKERGEEGTPLLDVMVDKVEDWKLYKYLQVRDAKSKKVLVEIFDNDFEDADFRQMVGAVKDYTIEYCGTALQKANYAYTKTQGYLNADKKLKNELLEAMNDAYRSVYQPFETLLSKNVVEELQQNPNVLFQSIKQGNVLAYYKKDCFQEGVASESIRIAENLIAASRENLEVIETRLASHQEVKSKLDKIIDQYTSQQRLTDVASKIDALQQKNVHQSIHMEDVALDTEVIEQIQQLTERINQTETIEKSLVLKEHIQMINHKDDEGIKDLNKRLE